MVNVAGKRVLPVLIVLVVVLIDALTKVWVVAALSASSMRLVGDFVELELVRNSGSAFSSFTGYTPILVAFALAVAAYLVREIGRSESRLRLVSLSLILGGATGNLIDRLFRSPGFFRGHVVDFVSVGSFPTFNIADCAITIGVGLLMISTFLKKAPGVHQVDRTN